MRHGGRPDPGEEWDGRTVPYGDRQRGRAVPGYVAYDAYDAYEDYGGYETLSYEPVSYETPAYGSSQAYEMPAYGPHPQHTQHTHTQHAQHTQHAPTPHAHPPQSPSAYGDPVYERGGAEGGYDVADETFGQGAMEPAGYGSVRFAGPVGEVAEEEAYGSAWEFEEGLARLLQNAAPESSAPRIPRQRLAHRRQPKRLARRAVRRIKCLAGGAGPVSWLKVVSLTMAAVAAVVAGVVGALGGVISYAPLRRLAVPGMMGELAAVWPLLVYGPWLVAAVSIVRAAVHRRRAAHSWFVVVVFSAIAVYLCVAHAGRSPICLAVAGLPPIAALVCFHQLVRQVTLTNPPRNGPRRPRHTTRRD